MTHHTKLFSKTNCQKDGSRLADARQRGLWVWFEGFGEKKEL